MENNYTYRSDSQIGESFDYNYDRAIEKGWIKYLYNKDIPFMWGWKKLKEDEHDN